MKPCILTIFLTFLVFASNASHANDRIFKFRLGGIQSKIASNFTKIDLRKTIKRNYSEQKNSTEHSFSNITEDSNNIAFIFYDGANVVVENYNHGAKPKTPLFAYSISKSFVGMMLLHSMCENNINSLDKKIGDVSARLKDTIYGSVTIRNTLKMQSGVGEHFFKKEQKPMFMSFLNKKKSPIDWINKINATNDQGKNFWYSANNTNALGIILEDITAKNIPENLNELFLKNIKLSNGIYWQYANNKEHVGAYGLMANAFDFVQMGKRFIQILDTNKCVENHYNSMMKEDRSNGKYGFQVWIHQTQRSEEKRKFYAMGFGGQFLIMDRDDGSVAFIYSLNKNYEFGKVIDEFYRLKYK